MNPANTNIPRPRRTTNRYGDVYRVWRFGGPRGCIKVVETRSIAGIPLPVSYKVVRLVAGDGVRPASEELLSVHRKRTAALRKAGKVKSR